MQIYGLSNILENKDKDCKGRLIKSAAFQIMSALLLRSLLLAMEM
jgi:hypothetical protein